MKVNHSVVERRTRDFKVASNKSDVIKGDKTADGVEREEESVCCCGRRAGTIKKKTRGSAAIIKQTNARLDNLWCRTSAKLAQIRPAIYSRRGQGRERRNESRGRFAGRYIGDGYLITFPLILYGKKGSREIE